MADEQKSVTRQIEHARAYAAQKGWTVLEQHVYVDDGVSGAEFAKRPGFVRLMNALTPRPPFQVLVMSEESRLGREAIETAYALKQLISAGVRVFFYLEDRERTLDSPIEKVMLSIQTMADEMEREKARQRMVDTMTRKAQAGHVTGGKCFGYDNVAVTGRRWPALARRAAHQRVRGRGRSVASSSWPPAGVGQAAIAKQLNAERAPAPSSQQGRPRAWVQSSVHEALFRPRYRGEIVWNRRRNVTSGASAATPSAVTEDGSGCQRRTCASSSDEIWTAAHARHRDAPVRTGPGRGASAASRVAVSAARARPVRLLRRRAACRHQDARGGRQLRYYACSSHFHRGTSVCPNALQVPMERC